jgi:hypothetical protein
VTTQRSTCPHHRATALYRTCALLLALATGVEAAPSNPAPAATGAVAVRERGAEDRPAIPCPKADRADPGCVAPDPHQRARVGSRCEVHHEQRLRLDLVPIHFGIATFIPGRNGPDELERYPNAWPWVGGGCVIGPQKFAEVAYCRRCRIAYQWERVTRALPWGRTR